MLPLCASAGLSFVLLPLTSHSPCPAVSADAAPRSQFHVAGRVSAPPLAMASDIDEICDVIPDTCQEVEADADAVFSIIDVNGDGEISRDELVAHLTGAGYTEAAVNLIFDKLDTNNDASLSQEELRMGFLQYTPLRKAPGLGSYNDKFVNEIHHDADALFATIDEDASGTITPLELRAHLEDTTEYTPRAIGNVFRLLDVNQDGEIERTELRAAFVKYSALRQAIGEGPNFK